MRSRQLQVPERITLRAQQRRKHIEIGNPGAGRDLWRNIAREDRPAAVGGQQTLDLRQGLVEAKRTISHLLEPKSPRPTSGLRIQIKRLLEADRARHASKSDNEGNFAFFSAEPPGRGVEIWFSPYEAFALRGCLAGCRSATRSVRRTDVARSGPFCRR